MVPFQNPSFKKKLLVYNSNYNQTLRKLTLTLVPTNRACSIKIIFRKKKKKKKHHLESKSNPLLICKFSRTCHLKPTTCSLKANDFSMCSNEILSSVHHSVKKRKYGETSKGWWFQPIWKIFPSNGKSSAIFPGENRKYFWNHRLVY